MDKDLIILELQQEIVELKQMNAVQAKAIELLMSRVSELENNQKKNSSNSSKPPSSDIGKTNRTQSLRSSSGTKPGGQSGHTGETLSFSATPDEIIEHVVSHCTCCGKNISGVNAGAYERRQVYDIPPIRVMITEHQSEIKHCPKCNTVNKAEFPAGVNQPVQYGEGVQTLAAYFTQYQLLPYARTAQIFQNLFGHSLSQSFLVNNNQRLACNLQPFIVDLKSKILKQPVLNLDETGCYIEGKRSWLHTISTERHSYYAPHTSRGREAMLDMGILAEYTGTVVHDFWKPYNEFACNHALCNVHHLRDLTFCEEVEKSIWAGNAKNFLLDLNEKVKSAKEAGLEALTKGQTQYWDRKFKTLLEEGQRIYPPPKKQKGKRGVTKKSKTENILERFIKHRSEVLAFSKNFQIPFGNNIAEQAIRMMKVKQKISGCFRSKKGASNFADIRSYIATMKKQGISIIQALRAAVQGSPIMALA